MNCFIHKKYDFILILERRHSTTVNSFIIKFPYNAGSDWLKQRALSEIRERIKLASKYLLRNLDKFDPNYKHLLCNSDKININELFVIWLIETIVDNSSVKTVRK